MNTSHHVPGAATSLRTQSRAGPHLSPARLPLGQPGRGISQQGSKHTQHRCVVNNFCFLPGKTEQQWWDQEGCRFTGNAGGVAARRGLSEVTGDCGHARSRAASHSTQSLF